MATLLPGDSVDNYRVESFIGAGSMGDVYKAVDASLGRPVALKLLSDRHRDNRELRRRFEREARAVAAISHGNVVQVFTTGSFDSRPYLAMEFLDGVDLASSVEAVGPWPALAVARAMRDAARGLEAAAAAGLIHRDVKPSNLVRLAGGKVVVTDFGLAKPLDPSAPALTAMGVVVGTPDYIAPEQARGEDIDARVDVYALGGTLFYMLTGRPPYRTGDPAEDKYLKVVQRHLKSPVPDARELAPRCHPDLSQLCREMMAKQPEQRPGFAEIVSRLERIIAELEAHGESAAVPGGSSSGRLVEPTPYLGDVSSPRPTASDVPAAPPPPDARYATSESFQVQAPQLSRALVAVTVGSALVFAAGLLLMLFGPMPRADVSGPDEAGAAGVLAPLDDAGLTPLPAAPEGMLAVRAPDGRVFFIAADPVNADDYARATKGRARPRPGDRGAPVTNVSFTQAEAYAAERGRRLPTSAEWEAATDAEGFRFAEGLWEWVTDVALSTQRRKIRAAPAQSSSRNLSAQADVSFRLAADAP